MQRIPISDSLSLDDVEEAKRLIDASEEVKAALNLNMVFDFFEHTELGQMLQRNKERLYREAPFAMLKMDNASHEKFVVRGIIDGFLRFDDRIILFDYKTDKYKNPLDIGHRYQDQMELYAEALQQAYGIHKIEKHLVLLGGKKVEIITL